MGHNYRAHFKMRTTAVVVIFAGCLIALGSAALFGCDDGFWGENCDKICGAGCQGAGDCDRDTGICEGTGCKDGWSSRDLSKQGRSSSNWASYKRTCDMPVCFGNLGCDYGGKCIAPNTCACQAFTGRSSIVEQEGQFPNLYGQPEEGINCINQRGWDRGVKGFAIAILVMVLSISTCGAIEVANTRAKAKKMK